MTNDFDAVLAVKKNRRDIEISEGNVKKDDPEMFQSGGISPQNLILRLDNWPSRRLAMDIICLINDNILRNYNPGVVIEQSLWVLPGDIEERKKIKDVLCLVFKEWVVEFSDGYGEMIVLRNPRET